MQAYNTNSQTHTDIGPHTSIQSCNANSPAHTDLQPHTIKTYSRTSQNTCVANVSQASHTLHTYPSTHNNTYTSDIETGKTIYTNDTLFEFQDNTGTLSPQGNTVHQRRQVHQGSAHGQRTLTHPETIDNGRAHSCIRVEAELKRMNTLLEKLLKCVQHRHNPSHKPAILPISSLTEMDIFERIDEEGYSDVRLCSNWHFEKPTRSEFQLQFREALRTVKERLRHRMRDRRTRSNNCERRINHNLWNDERPQESTNTVEQETTNDED
ncbi:uncharacterized protein [Polyergus mexicanus]|uniref:uncharacterized protein n=1 Tax=Polyergus mexicanus TaxID=615972 RepID=UPI0038B61A58